MDDFELKEKIFRLGIGKNFFPQKVARHWNGMPREAVASLEMFQARLDGILSNLVKWKVFLLMSGRLELDDL